MPELPYKICVNFSFDRIFVLRVIWHFCFGGQHFKNKNQNCQKGVSGGLNTTDVKYNEYF